MCFKRNHQDSEKTEKSQSLNPHQKKTKLEKNKQSSKLVEGRKMIKVIAEISGTNIKKKERSRERERENINETKSLFFENINKIDNF